MTRNINIIKFVVLFFCFILNAYCASINQTDAWTIIKNIQTKNHLSNFQIKYLDDKKQTFDFQSGTVYWFKEGTSQIIAHKPIEHRIWTKDNVLNDYMPELNQVVLSEISMNRSNLIFEFLIIPEKTLETQYTLKKSNDHITLFPKEKSSVKSIDVYYEKNNQPYRLIFKDMLNYESVLTIEQPVKLDKKQKYQITISNTAEVIDNVRHSTI